MSIFKKIKSFFHRKKKKENIVQIQIANQNVPNKNGYIYNIQGISIQNDNAKICKEGDSIMQEIFDNNINKVDKENKEEPLEFSKLEETNTLSLNNTTVLPIGHMMFQYDKDQVANLLRPIVKSYNNELKDEYKNAVPFDELKTLKTYVTLSENSFELIAKFTQSEKYNKEIQDFVREYIFEDFYKVFEKEQSGLYKYEYEIKDGQIKIKKYLNKQ